MDRILKAPAPAPYRKKEIYTADVKSDADLEGPLPSSIHIRRRRRAGFWPVRGFFVR